jgi:RHS repeat-associated protein
MLVSIENGSGGGVTIDYNPSTLLETNKLPFPIQTVRSISTNDGNNNIATTLYSYSDGFYHIGERDFRGFNYAKVTGPAGADGKNVITETWFHQGNETTVIPASATKAELKALANVQTGYMKGKPYRTKVSDGQGNVLSETTVSYAADVDGVPYFNPPLQVDNTVYDGDPTGRQTRTIYTYDGYGNVVEEDQYGDLSDPTDDRTIVRSFLPNTSNWIVGLPASEEIFQGIGTTNKIAGSTYYYDDLTDCNAAPMNNQASTPVTGNLTRTVKWLSGGSSPETRAAYDSYGNRLCQRDPNGNTTFIVYDSSNTFPTLVTNPLGHQTTTQYYGVNSIPADKGLYGQVKSITDPNNAVTIAEYDAFGRKTKTTLPDGTWTSMSYNNFGTVGSQHVRTDTSVGLWSLSYFDGLGRTFKTKSSGPDSKTIVNETQYDVRGAVKQVSYPYFEGLETPRYKAYLYDVAGRATQETNPDTTRTLACYKNGVTVKIDANNHRRREVRDVKGQIIKIQEYTGLFTTCDPAENTPYASTNYTYDVLGNLRFLTDAKGNQTEMRYDTLGRKNYMSDPDMGIWTYDYDANGNLKNQIDAKNNQIIFSYDELNRLRTKHYPTGPDVVMYYDEVTPNYFNKGRLTKMTDGSGQTVYNYDNAGRISNSTKTITGTPTPYTLGYTYLNGRLDSITYPDNTDTVSYKYDTAGNLNKVEGYVNYLNFDALGRPWDAAYGTAAASSHFSYNSVNSRLTGLSVLSPVQGLLINNSYGYDNKGNITSITDNLNKTLPTNLSSETYTPVRAHAVGSTGSGRVFHYDNNGNMDNDGQRSIVYDYDNMPTTIGNVSFTYDGVGTRVKKSSPGFSTDYIDKLYECTNGVCIKNIFAGSTRVATKTGSFVLYFHPDHQGSTAVVTDAQGNLFEDISYDPFGATRSDSIPPNTTSNVNHKYTGQELDAETGLYNYNARLYDPDLGRFLTPDTIVPDPENPQALNRYSYVINNPMLYSDPTGHSWWSKIWHGFLAAIKNADVDVSVSVNTSYGYGGSGSGPTVSINTGGSISSTPGKSSNPSMNNNGPSITAYSGGEWSSASSLYSQVLNGFRGYDNRLELKYIELAGNPYYKGDAGNTSSSGSFESGNRGFGQNVDWPKVMDIAINTVGYGVGVAALATESPLILTTALGYTVYSAYSTYKDYKSGEISTSHANANGVAVALNVAGVAVGKLPYMPAKMLGIGLGGLGRTIDTMNYGYSFLPK